MVIGDNSSPLKPEGLQGHMRSWGLLMKQLQATEKLDFCIYGTGRIHTKYYLNAYSTIPSKFCLTGLMLHTML